MGSKTKNLKLFAFYIYYFFVISGCFDKSDLTNSTFAFNKPGKCSKTCLDSTFMGLNKVEVSIFLIHIHFVLPK